MHASLEQLISLRDEDLVSLDVQQHVRSCEFCARVLNELAAVREGLASLPDPLPPADAWGRIEAPRRGAAQFRRSWLPAAGLGLVASLAAALLVVNPQLRRPGGAPVTTAAVSTQAVDIGQLQAQSQYLERAVLELNGNTASMPVSASTASTIAALEDNIALVDDEINNAPVRSGNESILAQLWQKRVDLLQSLAAVRYAQVADSGSI